MYLKQILLISLLVNVLKGNCQKYEQVPKSNKSTVIQNKKLFKYYGVIFDSSYEAAIKIKDIVGRFTPTEADISLAEDIFVTQFNLSNSRSPERKNAKSIDNVKEYYQFFNRQYIGYIDQMGDKNIIIQFFDFSNKKKVKRIVGDSWRRVFLGVLAENPPFETLFYRANITKKQLFVTF